MSDTKPTNNESQLARPTTNEASGKMYRRKPKEKLDAKSDVKETAVKSNGKGIVEAAELLADTTIQQAAQAYNSRMKEGMSELQSYINDFQEQLYANVEAKLGEGE